jgi:hypothetical protein
MDLRYMMLKDRYRFVYRPQVVIYDLKENIKREREISLYLKELALYKISFKVLIKSRPNPRIKDELLNIAYACLENESIYNGFRNTRVLPVKRVSDFTYKSKGFIEKWQFYIAAYILLLSGNAYQHLISYLSIEYKDRKEGVETTSMALVNDTAIKSNAHMGVVLKHLKNAAVILTPFGDFIKIKPNENSLLQPGYICTGILKKDISFYKYPIITVLFFSLILLLALTFMYLNPFRTVLIQANSTIKLEVNAWNRVVKVTPLSTYGNRIVQSLELFNTSTDKSIRLILQKAKNDNIINQETKVSIFITGTKNLELSLPETEAYILENNLTIQVNNNGTEYKIQNTPPKSSK